MPSTESRGRPRLAIPLAFAGIALLAAVLLTLGSEDDKPPAGRVVLGRVGVDRHLRTDPVVEGVRQRVGTETRLGLAPEGLSSWKLHLPDEAETVSFSFAASGLEEGEKAVFRGALEGDTSSAPLFEETAEAPAERWIDRQVRLQAGSGRTLVFEASAGAGGHPSNARLSWGSVSLTGPAPEDVRPADAAARPNVILISLDTLGARHVGFHGARPSPSPYLDRLLGRSRTFLNAFAPYPNTLVTHASLFTGLYPRRHGLYGGLQNYLEPTTLAMLLARHGYRTAAITEDTYVSSDFGFDRGFDSYENGSPEIRTQFLGDAKTTFAAAAEWLRSRGRETPYFLFVHTYEVHKPYLVRDRQVRDFVERLNPGYEGEFARYYPGMFFSNGHNNGQKLLSAADLEQISTLYRGEISYLDRQLRAFLGEIASLTDMENTLVVLFSDHGEEFGAHGFVGHGETLYDEVLHVVLAFHWPSRLEPSSLDEVVSLVDVMPTLLDLAGAAAPPGLDGVSLAPLLHGAVGPGGGRPAFAEMKTAWGACIRQGQPIDCPVDMISVRTPGFKMIETLLPPRRELYAVDEDPGETVDVSAAHPLELETLSELARAFREGAAVPGDQSDAARPEIDASTRERLRALGYLQ
jgi:arylsulfatase A-like enzyme